MKSAPSIALLLLIALAASLPAPEPQRLTAQMEYDRHGMGSIVCDIYEPQYHYRILSSTNLIDWIEWAMITRPCIRELYACTNAQQFFTIEVIDAATGATVETRRLGQ